MKSTTRQMLAATAITLTSALTVNAATWIGGTGTEFSTAANWDSGIAPPGESNETYIISGPVTVDRTESSSTFNTNVENGATLNVSGGTHNDNRAGNTIRNFVGSTTAGTVNVTGASTSYSIGHVLAIANGNNGNGAFTVSDGASVDIYRGSNNLIGTGGVVGGITYNASLSIGTAPGNTSTGLFEISGGSLSTRVGVNVGNGGTFSVVGSEVSSIVLGGSNVDAGWLILAAGSTLKATIDDSGITPIFVEKYAGTSGTFIQSIVNLASGALLDMDFASTPIAGTWTLVEMEDGDIVNDGFALTDSDIAAGWSFSVDNSGTNGLLQVTYVPEPSGAILGGLGLLALFRRRRN
ncbi:hypothetical protein ACFQY0_11830 [Haloferula chungangensis]|uniref:PEP-CTERM sorting domain-containing protein n=1 Tax=Haloferula chungangensis TaxID=1048331 RepID=A0ABW2L8I1_9BACT